MYENPTPVVVGLVPVEVSYDLLGLLVIKRGIEPGKGKIALPGGYLEMEDWKEGLSRELLEETGIDIDPGKWKPLDFASSFPAPNRVLLFGFCDSIRLMDIPDFNPNREVEEIGVLFRAMAMDDQVAFPLHMERIRSWLHGRPERYRYGMKPTGFASIKICKEVYAND